MVTSTNDYIPDGGRPLPFLLKFQVFFKSPVFWIGLTFTVISLLILPVLVYTFNFKSLEMSKDFPTTQGIVDNISIENKKSGRGSSGDVLGTFYFSYTHTDGKVYHNVSYLKKQYEDLVNLKYNFESANNKCKVHFSPNDPDLAYIDGMSISTTSVWIFLIILPFLIGGSALVYKGIKKGIHSIHLLKFGISGFGTFLRKEDTGMIVNTKHVYKLFFNLKAADGNNYEVSCISTTPQNLEDEPEEKLVYNSLNPSDAALIDSLPKIVKTYFSNN